MEPVQEKTIKICEQLQRSRREPVLPVALESTFVSLGFDSLDMVEIAMSAEDEFDIVLDDNKISQLSTVQELVDMIVNLNSLKGLQ